jgi:hypothetical protein
MVPAASFSTAPMNPGWRKTMHRLLPGLVAEIIDFQQWWCSAAGGKPRAHFLAKGTRTDAGLSAFCARKPSSVPYEQARPTCLTFAVLESIQQARAINWHDV